MTRSPESPQLFTQYPGVEPIAYYRKGGFHPIHIDDVLHNRYRVVNKLGYGAYATIWLVEDINSGRCAALKVLAAEVAKNSEVQESEVAILRHLKQRRLNADGGSDGHEFLMEYFDDFKVEGPNGTHQCIVTEVLGPSIGTDLDEIYEEDRYPVEIAKRLVAQLTRGVAYLHRSGVVHGDLHVGNILLRIPGTEPISCHDLQKYLGEPYKRPLSDGDGKPVTSDPHKPKYVVTSPGRLELLQLCLSSPEAIHLKICDFGEAFLWDDKPVTTQLNTPCVYAAPEIIFHDYVTPAVDVWALAVLIHMILSGGSLLFNSYRGIKQEVLREMVLTLGKLPDRWWTKWGDRTEYFDEDGAFIGDRTTLPPVSGKFLKIPPARLEGEELKELERVIRKMVSYAITDRISAAEVVRLIPETWMKEVDQLEPTSSPRWTISD